jgi:hypothetical protein
MKHLGDITKISGYNAPLVDCIIGGRRMKKYKIKAYGNFERRLKQKEKVITAKDEEDAWIKAWKEFAEYDEIGVTEVNAEE